MDSGEGGGDLLGHHQEGVERLIREGGDKGQAGRGISRGRKREGRGGRAAGRAPGGPRLPEKERWMRRVRALRKRLRELRESGKISRSEYRRLYRRVSGGVLQDQGPPGGVPQGEGGKE